MMPPDCAKVILLHPHPVYGAIEAYVGDLAGGLAERGVEVCLWHPASQALAPLDGLLDRGVQVKTFPLLLLHGSALAGLPILAGGLRSEGGAVVHVTEWWPTGILAARLAGYRSVVTHHTPSLPRRDNWKGRVMNALAERSSPTVIFTSEADRRQFGASGLRSAAIPLGIDWRRFQSGPPSPRIRRTEGWAGRWPVIGNVARLTEQKGQRFLVEAAIAILARHPRALFVLVGEGELHQALEQQITELGIANAFLFLGYRRDVAALLTGFDLFVLPSLFEGLCYAVLEAQAAGIPVVATSVGGVRDTVIPDSTGYLVPPGDADALAGAILRALSEPAQARRMAGLAQVRVRQEFGIDTMIDRTVHLYALAHASPFP